MTTPQIMLESKAFNQRRKRLHNKHQSYYRKRQRIGYGTGIHSINGQDVTGINCQRGME